MKKSLLYITIVMLAGISLMLSAFRSNELTGKGPLRVIFETDMGNDVDDALALVMLYRYAGQGKIDLLGISSNKDNRYSTEYIDILNTWYGYPDLPVGHVVKGVYCERDAVNYAQKVCEMKASDGRLLFKRSKTPSDASPESAILYRSILSRQPNHSVCIISTGFSTNLARLLETPADKYSPMNGKDLIAKKVKSLVLMGGDFRKDRIKEYNILRDGPAARKVFAEWPTPVVASPLDVGEGILYPAKVIENDSLWVKPHPVTEAYKVYLPMPYDRPSWDETAVLYAVEPDAGYFNRSEQGTITVEKNNFTTFTPVKKGKHAYLSVTPGQAEKVKERIIYLTTGRFHKD